MSITIIEDFNSLNTAKLDGQNGWADTAGTSGMQLVAGVTSLVNPYEGAKADFMTSGVDIEIVSKDITARTAGHFGYWSYIQSTPQSDGTRNSFYLMSVSGGQVCRGRFQYVAASTNCQFQLLSGTDTILSTTTGITANAWHNFDLGFDPVADKVRYRIDGGSWSAWFATINTFSQVDRIRIYYEPDAAGLLAVDYIYYDNEGGAANGNFLAFF